MSSNLAGTRFFDSPGRARVPIPVPLQEDRPGAFHARVAERVRSTRACIVDVLSLEDYGTLMGLTGTDRRQSPRGGNLIRAASRVSNPGT